MSKVSPTDHGIADYVLELSDDELDDLRTAVRDADGRKTAVKNAKETLGISHR